MKTNIGNILLFVQIEEIDYNSASNSRFLYISNELETIGFNTLLVGKHAQLKDERIIDFKIRAGQKFLDNLIQDIQIYIYAIKYMLKKDVYAIFVRRCMYLMPLILLGKILRKKVFYDFHGYTTEDNKSNLLKKANNYTELLSLYISDYIISVSEPIRKEVPTKKLKNTIIIENGADIKEFSQPYDSGEILKLRKKYGVMREDYKTIIFVVGGSRSIYYPEDMIEMQKYIEDIYTLIICSLNNYPSLKEMANMHNNVLIHDNIPHKEVILLLKYIADVCIIPYDKNHINANLENYCCCRKSSEYLASGKPIIISNVKRIPHYMENNKNYIAYESRNPKDLAEKVKKILNDHQLYAHISSNNIVLSEQLSWEQNVQKSTIIDLLRK